MLLQPSLHFPMQEQDRLRSLPLRRDSLRLDIQTLSLPEMHLGTPQSPKEITWHTEHPDILELPVWQLFAPMDDYSHARL
ncbi:hypothetical protein ES708_33601 [subsurface metagenome]